MLHGTGGDENDLLELGRQLGPTANLLSPCGHALEQGMPRFFRRIATGVFDEEDIIRRTHKLADFVAKAAQTYDFDPMQVMAVGYSNGANIAVSTLLLRPETLAGAVLLHALVPLEPAQLPISMRVRSWSARAAPILFVSPAKTEQLVDLLRRAGATVMVQWWPGGHALVLPAVIAAQTWLKDVRDG